MIIHARVGGAAIKDACVYRYQSDSFLVQLLIKIYIYGTFAVILCHLLCVKIFFVIIKM